MNTKTSLGSRRTFFKNSMKTIGAIAGTLTGVSVFALKEDLPPSQATPRQTLGPFFPDDGDPVTEIRENLDFRLPISEANDNDLTTIRGKKGKSKGQVVYVKGKVLLNRGGTLKPLIGAVLIEWNASASGRYNHRGDQDNTRFQHPISHEWIERSHDDNFQYWGRCITDAEGNYIFKTIIPGFYPVNLEERWYRPPHLHFMVMAAGVPQVVTQLYFKGDQIPNNEFIQELNSKDNILRSKRMTHSEQESVVIEYKKDTAGVFIDGLVGHYNFVLTL